MELFLYILIFVLLECSLCWLFYEYGYAKRDLVLIEELEKKENNLELEDKVMSFVFKALEAKEKTESSLRIDKIMSEINNIAPKKNKRKNKKRGNK